MAKIEGRPLSDIDLDNKHERRELKARIGSASSILVPVKAGGVKKTIANVEKGYEAPPYELEALNHARSEFTPEEKLQAVMAYIATGNSEVASEFCNVSPRTIRYWKDKAKWWPDAVRICRLRIAEKLDGRFSEIIHLATDELFDRIKKGDVQLVNGRRRRVPLKARDLTQIISTIFDKRATARGDPTQITERKEGSTQENLENLKDTFETFAERWKDEREEKVIDEQ